MGFNDVHCEYKSKFCHLGDDHCRLCFVRFGQRLPLEDLKMLRFLIFGLCICLSVAQKPSSEAAIISESRYLNTAGQFGSSYTQEDGVEFKEEADSEGNRKGSYTYIDPNGVRRTLTYTAGKGGFQASGDHLPVPPPANPFPVPNLPALYHVQSQVNNQPVQPNALQVQFQSIPVPGSPLLNLFHVQPVPIVSSTEVPVTSHPNRHYPAGKLNVKQTADGFSYTFNSLVQ